MCGHRLSLASRPGGLISFLEWPPSAVASSALSLPEKALLRCQPNKPFASAMTAASPQSAEWTKVAARSKAAAKVAGSLRCGATPPRTWCSCTKLH